MKRLVFLLLFLVPLLFLAPGCGSNQKKAPTDSQNGSDDAKKKGGKGGPSFR